MHKQAIAAALEAGKVILEIYESNDFGMELKGDNSPLTKADKAGHEAIVKGLSVTGYPVLSEEGKTIPYTERKHWERFWMVDPLDGTKEFIKRNGEFTVNIALIESGVPVMGVIYVPVKQTLYYTASGKSYKAEGVLASNAISEIEAKAVLLPVERGSRKYTVVGSRSHMSEETTAFIEEKKQIHGETEIISMGSSLKLCLVAEGYADVYPRLAPTMEWDTAAGDAIARGAGCTVKQYGTGEDVKYNKEDLLNPWFLVERRKAEGVRGKA